MAKQTIKMEQLNNILRLKKQGFSKRTIAKLTGLSRNTIKKYLSKLVDDPVDNMPSSQSKTQLIKGDTTTFVSTRHEELKAYFKETAGEIKGTGVTLQRLWMEYKERYENGFEYSQYCNHYRTYNNNKEVTMHLEHHAGESCMIDFAGEKLSYIDRSTGEIIPCPVFIGVLPYSGLTFCQAVHHQNTYDFNDCINEMLIYFKGSAKIIQCDNLRTAVIRPGRYEPVYTELCYQLSEHFSTCFNATRPYKPRDKAMVERSVQIVYNHIYAPLRKHTFYSLKELNAFIRIQLDLLNDKKYKGSGYSRRQLFSENEASLLTPLPSNRFNVKKTVMATVQRNYHVQLSENHHYYSVPYIHVGKKVKVLYDQHIVEIYSDHIRIALHHLDSLSKAYHTHSDHMPSNHQHMHTIRGWTKDDLLNQASRLGEYTLQVANHILSASIYPVQNFKSCHGLIMLKQKYTPVRIDNACKRALNGHRIRYTTICDILKSGLDQQLNQMEQVESIPVHDNIRGAHHYQ